MSRLAIAAAVAALLGAGVFVATAPARAESVMKECGAEWKTAKTNNATNGQTWKDFLKDCRGRHEQANAEPAPAPAPAPAASPTPTPTTMAAPAAAPATAPTPKPIRTRMAKVEEPTEGQYASEGDAKFRCGSDAVVWVNTKSHKYHYAGNRSYGTTKHGAYMCEANAKSAGDAAAKNEKPKT